MKLSARCDPEPWFLRQRAPELQLLGGWLTFHQKDSSTIGPGQRSRINFSPKSRSPDQTRILKKLGSCYVFGALSQWPRRSDNQHRRCQFSVSLLLTPLELRASDCVVAFSIASRNARLMGALHIKSLCYLYNNWAYEY